MTAIRVFVMRNKDEPLEVASLSIHRIYTWSRAWWSRLILPRCKLAASPYAPSLWMEMQDFAAIQAPSCAHNSVPFTAPPAHAVGFAGCCSLSLLTTGR